MEGLSSEYRLINAFPWLVLVMATWTLFAWLNRCPPDPEDIKEDSRIRDSSPGDMSIVPMSIVAVSVVFVFLTLLMIIRCDAASCDSSGKWVGDQTINRLEIQVR